jgi:hypothetical protein
MQKPFTTQSELFVSSSDIDHPILHSLDDTEALLEWSKLECLLYWAVAFPCSAAAVNSATDCAQAEDTAKTNPQNNIANQGLKRDVFKVIATPSNNYSILSENKLN